LLVLIYKTYQYFSTAIVRRKINLSVLCRFFRFKFLWISKDGPVHLCHIPHESWHAPGQPSVSVWTALSEYQCLHLCLISRLLVLFFCSSSQGFTDEMPLALSFSDYFTVWNMSSVCRVEKWTWTTFLTLRI